MIRFTLECFTFKLTIESVTNVLRDAKVDQYIINAHSFSIKRQIVVVFLMSWGCYLHIS